MGKTFLSLFFLLLVACSSLQTPEFRTGNSHRAIHNYNTTDGLAFSWPLERYSFSRGFHKGRWGRPHLGIDLAAPTGTTIYASHNGYVEYAGKQFKGYGNIIILNSGGQWSTFYAHLSKINVKEGQSIERGQVIGLVGRTGRATGSHLHFELRKSLAPVNPLDYLPN